MTNYSEYDLHLVLADEMNLNDEIIEGVAIKSEDLTAFLMDYRQLCKRYGVLYEELLENDYEEDTSATAAANLYWKAERGVKVEDTVEIEPSAARSDKGL